MVSAHSSSLDDIGLLMLQDELQASKIDRELNSIDDQVYVDENRQQLLCPRRALAV